MPLMPNSLDTLYYQQTPPQSHDRTVAAAGAIAGGIAVASLFYAVSYIHRILTERRPLSNEDLIRYDILASAYREMGEDIIEAWRLDNKKTTFALNYRDAVSSLEMSVNELRRNPSAVNLARLGITHSLQNYLKSVCQRSWMTDKITGAYESPDGIEAMFLKEMLMWCQLKMSVKNVLKKETRDDLEKRIIYYKKVLVGIVANHMHNEERANFKQFLERLIDETEEYLNHLIQKDESATFDELIEEISGNLLGLSSESFEILYLLIDGSNRSFLSFNSRSHRPERQPFIIKQFMNPKESEPKVQKIRNKRMGEWLFQTIQMTGITGSTYVANALLKQHAIKKHLDGELPSDFPCNLSTVSTELRNMRDTTAWGHWKFVDEVSQESNRYFYSSFFQENSSSYLSERYLIQIRELHRLTLQFYYIRQNLLRAAKVASVFGEIWIYGDRVGKAVLEELLSGISEVVQDYLTTFNSFWIKYFEGHRERTRENGEDDYRYLCHNCLHRIDLIHKIAIQRTARDIEELILRIRQQAKKLPSELEKIRHTKVELFSDLLDFLVVRKKETTLNYQIIQDELTAMTQSVPTLISSTTKSKKEDEKLPSSNSEFSEELTQIFQRVENEGAIHEKQSIR